MPTLSPLVRKVTDELMGLHDARLPGQLEALYLVGSIALDDFHPGNSDIDFVAVLSGRQDLTRIAGIHIELARRFPNIHCDGIYLQPGQLLEPPVGYGPEVREGKLLSQSGGERHAVTWQLLADAGIALRGPDPRTGWVAASRDAAIAYSRANLRTYWRPWLQQRRHLLSRHGWELLRNDSIEWGCLGIARLHATMGSGHVPSKSSAGDYAIKAFPRHADIIREALYLHKHPGTGSKYGDVLGRRRDAIAFMDAVLKDGLGGRK